MSINLIIPARYGSTRFPGKPLALIHGKPMIQHVYERAMQAKGLDHIYVATDDERIRDVVEGFGGQVVMTSSEAASGTDRIDDAATRLGLADDDLIINLQGDQPLIDPCSIEKLVQLFVDAPGEFEMATLAFQLNDPVDQNDPMQVKMVFDQAFFALYFSRAKIPFNRDAEDESPIYKHLGIYGYTRRFVREFGRLPVSRLENVEKLEQLRALENGYRIKIAVVDANPPEVDMPEDIAKCEAFLAKQS